MLDKLQSFFISIRTLISHLLNKHLVRVHDGCFLLNSLIIFVFSITRASMILATIWLKHWRIFLHLVTLMFQSCLLNSHHPIITLKWIGFNIIPFLQNSLFLFSFILKSWKFKNGFQFDVMVNTNCISVQINRLIFVLL